MCWAYCLAVVQYLSAATSEVEEVQREWSWVEQAAPAGWSDEPIRLDRFWASSIPSSYVFLAQDQAVPAEIYQAAAGRLDSPRTIEIDGSHLVMLTHPERLARALDAVIA